MTLILQPSSGGLRTASRSNPILFSYVKGPLRVWRYFLKDFELENLIRMLGDLLKLPFSIPLLVHRLPYILIAVLVPPQVDHAIVCIP